jgi:hypothetical protein
MCEFVCVNLSEEEQKCGVSVCYYSARFFLFLFFF